VAQGEGPEFKPQYCKKKKKIIVECLLCLSSLHGLCHSFLYIQCLNECLINIFGNQQILIGDTGK
jgi:hypothetical protein